MRSLFLRIFIWFWIALGLAVAALVVSSPLLTRSRPGLGRWQRAAEGSAEREARAVAQRVEREGWQALDERRGHGRGPLGPAVFLFGQAGEVLVGPEPPREVRELAQRVAERGVEESERMGIFYTVALPVTDPDGSALVLVVGHRRPPRVEHLLEPRVLAPRLLLLLLIAGAVCYLLARHLTAPIAALRSASRRLADGDLAARVGDKVGGRRDEIGDLARDLDVMASRLQSLIEAQKRLLQDVSHELRSPLARLGVALELARREAGEGAARSLARVEREAGRLNQLIEQLLTLTRLESGNAERAAVRIDLGALVEGVVADARFEAQGRGCEVHHSCAEPVTLKGDPGLVRSAVDNVVRNAVRYTAPDTAVAVTVSREGERALVRVRDHGPGVPAEELGKLFMPFYRVGEARDRSSGGGGLGLAITERAVRWHGGAVSAANAEDGGLVVELSFPIGEQR